MRTTRIIVPCYNEAQRLDPAAFLGALENEPALSFLFVDDGSTDRTLQLLESIRAKNPAQVGLLHLDSNSGKAEAVRRGILASLEGSFENLGYWDADLATPLSEIDGFCRLLESPDVEVVIGSRVCLLGRKIERKLVRHLVGRVFATCASILLEIPVYDTQCGAKIFRNSSALGRVFGRPFKVNWTFDVEMFARFPIVEGESPQQTSSRWVEFPLTEWVDVQGSKVRIKDYIKGGLDYCLLFYYLRTPARRLYQRYLSGA